MKRQRIALTILISLLSCCGYSTRSLLPSYMKVARIQFFENRSLQPLLAEIFTDRLKSAFIKERMKITSGPDADLEVEGKILSYSRSPHTYTEDQTIIQYRMTLRISVRVFDLVKNQVFFEKEISGYIDQPADEDEELWIPKMCEEVAGLTVQEIFTHW